MRALCAPCTDGKGEAVGADGMAHLEQGGTGQEMA